MATYNGANRAIGFLFTVINNIADEYSSSSSYVVGDYVLHEGTLYKCTTAISTPEDFTPSHWQLVLIMDEIAAGGGGGGTTVIANPAGAATDTLNKLQVQNTIYSIPSGGGSGSFTNTLLLNNTDFSVESGSAQVTRTYTLIDDYTNYDALVVHAFMYNGSLGQYLLAGQYIPIALVGLGNPSNKSSEFVLSGGISQRQLRFGFSDSVTLKSETVNRYTGEEPRICRVYGLKYSNP